MANINCFNIITEGQEKVDLTNYTPAADIKKGDLVVIGGVKAAVADLSYLVADAPIPDAGFAIRGEYRFALADITGAADTTVSGTAVYVDLTAGTLTLTKADGLEVFGFVTRNEGDTLWVKEI
jgi:predicted RecA/RadA family phage recombinase